MPRTLPIKGLVLVVLLVTVGCQSEAPISPSASQLSVPAAAESGQPHLYAEKEGDIWLSWVAPGGEDQHALRYATLRDTGWGEPRTAVQGSDWFVNWADVPSLRPLPNGRLAAHVLKSNGPSPLAYAVRITQTSADGIWQQPVTPHADGAKAEHGFVSIVPWPQNRLLAVWLDGRKMAEKEGHAGEMTLRGAVLDSTGAVEQRARLDARTCECCPTAAVRTDEDALVAYRDRSENEVRNIRLVRFDGQSWSEPTRLHDDGWQIEGCPVNGPALAASGAQVVAAWYTASGGTPRVKVAFSDDGGRQFTEPVVVAEGTPKGRVDVVLLEEGRAAVSWLDQTDAGAALRVQALSSDEFLGAPMTIAALGAASRGVGMPHLERQGRSLYAAWTEPDEGGVQAARLSVDALR